MRYCSQFYQKNFDIITKICFPIILFFYPFATVNQGVDVSDTLYSMTNFLFFPEMEGMWVLSTYAANLAGWFMTKLPFGTAVLGLNIYTGLLVSATALIVYFMLKKWMPAWIAFLGQIAAISYCWIPTAILYNYLTYFFFVLGALYLYKGLVEEKDRNLILAGFFLGFNVFVRVPNLTQMALILGLWYYMGSKRKALSEIAGKTLFCMGGYGAGILIPLILILIQYGPRAIFGMISDLANIQQGDSSYSLGAMIISVFQAYIRTSKWVLLIALAVALGTAMFFCLKERFKKAKRIVYVAGICLLIRFLWGRGMFSFRYYEDYTSMYEWGMIGLYLAWLGAILILVSAKSSREEKLWGVLAMIITAVTPLGSNNYTYQNLNNLFFIAPFTIYTFVKLYRRRSVKKRLEELAVPWKYMVLALGGMILIQGMGFHFQFVFRDGMDGEQRSYLFRSPRTVAGMRTTKTNGEELQSVLDYMEKEVPGGKEVLLYGDCPGISFLTGRAFAIHTPWPDLDSEGYNKMEQQIEEMEGYPVVVIRHKENPGKMEAAKKSLIEKYMTKNQYTEVYRNNSYTIYKTSKE